MSEKYDAERDPVSRVLARSVEQLDTDPCIRLSRVFLQQARALLLVAVRHAPWRSYAWFGRRCAVAATVLALVLAGMPVLAGPGGFPGSVQQVFAAFSKHDRVTLLQDVTPTANEMVEPLETVELTGTVELSQILQPSPFAEPTETVEPTRTAEPTETPEPTPMSEPTMTVEPTPEPTETVGPTPIRVSEVARDNHGRAVSAVAQSNDGEGNHGQEVREVARDNHGRDVSEATKGRQEADKQHQQDGEELTPSVPDVARDNHGARVRQAAPSQGNGHGKEGQSGRAGGR